MAPALVAPALVAPVLVVAALVVAALVAAPTWPLPSAFPASRTSVAGPGPGAGSGATALLALPGGVVWDYDGSEVMRSTDAGATWGTVLPPWALTATSLHVTGAFFLSAEDAWAETEHEWPAQPGATTVWQTTDGGASWRQGISLPGAPAYGTPGFDELAFADAEHGFGFGVNAVGTTNFQQRRTGAFWTTSDGGRDWSRTRARGLPWDGSTYSLISQKGCEQADPFNLTVPSASAALLWEAACPTTVPGVWRSADGGRTWGPVRLPPPPEGWARAEAWGYPVRGNSPRENGAEVMAMRFFGDQGVAAVTTRPGELLVYVSKDSGISWVLASALETGSLARPAGFWSLAPLTWALPAPAGLYLSADGGRHWELQGSGLSLPDMTEVSFSSLRTGVGFAEGSSVGLASTGGTGMLTGDGGRSWGAVEFAAPAYLGNFNAEVPFSTVEFAKPEDGWLGGADGIDATRDGGATWKQQLAPAEPVEQLSFSDADHGWALTPDELFATSDGGLRWSVRPETAFGAFSSVQLVNTGFGTGVVCGQAGGTRVLVTYNQGQTWSVLPLPNANELQCGSAPPSPQAISGTCFGTAQVGWAVLDASPAGSAVVERTGDGGLHWSAPAKLNGFPDAMACRGTSAAWLGFTYGEHGGAGGIIGTTDGGRTWRTSIRPSPSGDGVFSPRLSPLDGTAVGTLGPWQEPAGILGLPVGGLAAPGTGDIVDLWEDGSAACLSGFGLVLSTDGGTSWTSAPAGAALPSCGAAALPYVSAVFFVPPSFSFLDARDGFVLAPAAGTPATPERPTEPVTMSLVGTTDAGRSWHLVARFPWPG